MQSIGGGVGGSATSGGPAVSLSIGGAGGTGGTGAAVNLATTPGLNVSTSGSNSDGLNAKSIGGGGGSAGAAYTIAVNSTFAAAVSVGGSGGNGGSGGAVVVDVNGATINTGLAANAHVDPSTVPDGTILVPVPIRSAGVLAQSVGNGGGQGGPATAEAVAGDFLTGIVAAVATGGSVKASFAVSASFAIGGNGGGGGDGGTTTVDFRNGSTITTNGNNAAGIDAESTGGGGGDGGDASATSATFGLKDVAATLGKKNYNFVLTVTAGGSGAYGGNGGAVSVTLGGTNLTPDPNGTPATSITTLGDYSYGVLAQSVGGGGGNAGFGAGSTQNFTSSLQALTGNITVGRDGGPGGTGDAVHVAQYAPNAIKTYGDSAFGIFAQSVGGGGGNSSGGSYQVGLPSLNSFTGSSSLPQQFNSSVTVQAGTKGATGGNGGTVTVDLGGIVQTFGEAARGVVAQSVGGGGGIAGPAGSGASSDNPTVFDQFKTAKKVADNAVLTYVASFANAVATGGSKLDALTAYLPEINFNLSYGASGGGGGNGGDVSVNLNFPMIATAGAYADGVLAQSIGGGGGAGGAAVAGGSSGAGSFFNINYNAALGGSGGGGGTGGAVSANVAGGGIQTSGDAANALVLESVGGGGGDDGSAETNAGGAVSLGAARSSSGGGGGNGGTVTLTGATAGTGVFALGTSGAMAHGLLLQSVGGGGGISIQGTVQSLQFAQLNDLSTSKTLYSAGAGESAFGNGGSVAITTPPVLHIATSGPASYGILAQSVGGGGGIVAQTPGTQATYKMGGSSSITNEGGPVQLTLADGSSIRTTGDDSIGILAQSVGAGGGIVGYPGGPALIYAAKPADGPNATTGLTASGSGGAVTINTGNATITTSGQAAHGIFAQSVGAGGGIEAGNDSVSLIAGTTGAPGSSGSGGAITIVQNGTVQASGENSIGIFAQSVGATAGQPISIQVNGSVSGGSGQQGAGVVQWSDNASNTLVVGSHGRIRAASGLAILAMGTSAVEVDNGGTVEGSYSLATPGSAGTFNNLATGTLIARGTLTGDLNNAGLIAPPLANAGAPIVVQGNFSQEAGGVFAPHVSFRNGQADMLVVTGNAVLEGMVQPIVTDVVPRTPVTILSVNGAAAGQLSARSSALFGYAVTEVGDGADPQYALTNVSANFTPAGIALNRLQGSAAAPAVDLGQRRRAGTWRGVRAARRSRGQRPGPLRRRARAARPTGAGRSRLACAVRPGQLRL